MEDPISPEDRRDKITLTLHDISSGYSGSIGTRVINLVGTERVAIGRASKRGVKERVPAAHNAWFDCRVMSRDHAMLGTLQVGFKAPVPVLCDTDSTHGTWVNGRKLKPGETVELSNDDVVKFGVDIQRGEEEFFALSAHCRIEESRDASVVTELPIVRSTSTNTFCVPEDSDIEDDQDQTISLPSNKAVDISVDDEYRLPAGFLNTAKETFEQLQMEAEARFDLVDDEDISSSDEDPSETGLREIMIRDHLDDIGNFASAVGSEEESEEDAWSIGSGASSDDDSDISNSSSESDSGFDSADQTDVNPEEAIQFPSIDPRLLMSQHNDRADARESLENNRTEILKNPMFWAETVKAGIDQKDSHDSHLPSPVTERVVHKESLDAPWPSPKKESSDSLLSSPVTNPILQKDIPAFSLPSPTKSAPYSDGPFSCKDLPREDEIITNEAYVLSTLPLSTQKRKACEIEMDSPEVGSPEVCKTLVVSQGTQFSSTIPQSQVAEAERPVKRAKFSRAFSKIAKVATAGTEAAVTAGPFAIGVVVGTITTIATLASLPAGMFE